MDGVSFGIAELSWNLAFQLVNTAILLLLMGAAIYALILFIKAAKRVIRATDVYMHEKAGKNNPE